MYFNTLPCIVTGKGVRGEPVSGPRPRHSQVCVRRSATIRPGARAALDHDTAIKRCDTTLQGAQGRGVRRVGACSTALAAQRAGARVCTL